MDSSTSDFKLTNLNVSKNKSGRGPYTSLSIDQYEAIFAMVFMRNNVKSVEANDIIKGGRVLSFM
jgi:hypothetical protein